MHPVRRSVGVILFVAALIAGSFLYAQEDAVVEAARESIGTATRKFVTAFNVGDTATMLSLWTKSGDFVDGDHPRVFFRDRIVAAANAAAKDQDGPQIRSSLVMTISNIRFVTSQVAMVDGNTIYKSSAGAQADHDRYSAVWVLRDNHWLLDSIRENPVPVDLHNAHLKELEAMVGDWIDNDSDPHMELHIRWSSDGNYLLGEFKSQLPGRGFHAGTKRIGWDAQFAQFRSWAFANDGGFAQGLWTAFEKGWTLEINGATADGKATADQIQIVKVDNNTMEWIYENGTLDGQPLPDFRLQLFRQSPK